LQDPPKFTQICFFGLKIITIWQPCAWVAASGQKQKPRLKKHFEHFCIPECINVNLMS
jgi:hypothetical protein